MSKQFTFNKQEKLKSRKLIEYLFKKGNSVSVFPLKVLYDFVDEAPVFLQAGVTVSSRTFKKAVVRNQIKRILREAYRLQKLPLYNLVAVNNKPIALFFIYIGKELPIYADVYEKMGLILKRLEEKIVKAGYN